MDMDTHNKIDGWYSHAMLYFKQHITWHASNNLRVPSQAFSNYIINLADFPICFNEANDYHCRVKFNYSTN
jgi:hypothetical protein